jgi:hypothetical protein
MTSKRQTVLILTSDRAFSREVIANWPHDPAHSPEFVVLNQDFSRDLVSSNYDLAIADVSSSDLSSNSSAKKINATKINAMKQSLAAAVKPVIVINNMIHNDAAGDLYHLEGSILELRREPGLWPALAGLIGHEILRRCQAESRARQAETISAAAQADATLGRYMIEMRTNVNNALTTVLGNAELLVLEPGLPATVQAQADTIRNMALRLHEVFQRFSSIEKELTVEARESGKKSARAAVGRS